MTCRRHADAERPEPDRRERCPISTQRARPARRVVLRPPAPGAARLAPRRGGRHRARAVGREPAGQQLRPGQLALAAGPEPPGEPVPVPERRHCGRGPALAESARQPRQRRDHRPAGEVPATPGTRLRRAKSARPWRQPAAVARPPDRLRGGPVRRPGRGPACERRPAGDRHRRQLRPARPAGGGRGRTGRAGRLGRSRVERDDRARWPPSWSCSSPSGRWWPWACRS